MLARPLQLNAAIPSPGYAAPSPRTLTESIRADNATAGSSEGISGTKEAPTAVVGGGGPLNRPVAVSMVKLPAWAARSVPSSPKAPNTRLASRSLVDGSVGVTALVLRADSRLDGPEATELMSNAVTE